MSSKVRLHHVAELCQCSTATVSRALRNHPAISAEAIAKIQEAARSLGYLGKRGKGKAIWLVMDPAALSGEFERRLAVHLEKAFADCGLTLCTVSAKGQALERPQEWLRNGVCGLLFYHLSPALSAKLTTAVSPPLVRLDLDPTVDRPHCHAVLLDHQSGAYEATDYLVRLGHKNILMLGGPLREPVHQERARGFAAALATHGLAEGASQRVSHGADTAEDSFRRLSHCLAAAHSRPTAVFAASDRLALGAYKAIREKGLAVPGAISLLGFHDAEWMTYVTPEITTVEFPTPDLAKATLDTWSNVMANPSGCVFHQVIVKPRLIIRQSCTYES